MGLSRFREAFDEGFIQLFIIHAGLSIAILVMDILFFLLQKLGLKVNTETTESAETLLSFAYAEEEGTSDLGSGVAQLAMTAEEIADRLPVSLFEASSSSFLSVGSSSRGDGDGDGDGECVVCLTKFHGGEEIRSLSCSHVFHKSCVDKWLLDYDYENMTCPLCRRCLLNVVTKDDGSTREYHLMEEQVGADKRSLSSFPDASEGGAIPFLIIHATLCISMVKDIVIFLFRKISLKVNIETTESAETLLSFADVEEESPNLGSRVAQLAMNAEQIGDRLLVSLVEASSSSFSCSEGDDVSECVVCLTKFHGGEEIRSLPCDHLFHQSCVDKWFLDYKNMTCPLSRRCPVNVAAKDDGSTRV